MGWYDHYPAESKSVRSMLKPEFVLSEIWMIFSVLFWESSLRVYAALNGGKLFVEKLNPHAYLM